MAKKTGVPTTPLSVRFKPAIMERIRYAAERLGMKEIDVIRLAASIGLEHLRRVDYDLTKLVLDASIGEELPILKAADPAAEFGTKKKGQ